MGFLCNFSCAQVSTSKNSSSRAGAAGHHHQRIAVHKHDLFAFMHIFGHNKVGQIGFAHFSFHQMRWNHAKGFPTSLLGGPGDSAHQTNIASAIHKSRAGRGNRMAQSLCLRDVVGQNACS